MKKIISTFILVLVANATFAQVNSSEPKAEPSNTKNQVETFKPEKGAFSVEMMFNPLNINSGTFGLEGLRSRFFLTEKTALRLNIGIAIADTMLRVRRSSYENYISEENNKSFALSFSPGMEFHLGNLKRLSPYVGFDIQLGWTRSVSSSVSGFIFGVGAIIGADFYVYKGLYLGAEFALRYNLITASTDDEKIQTSLNSFGFVPVPSIRLGWQF